MKVNTIMLEIVECSRAELEFEEARNHYERMRRREREKRKALLALLDKKAPRSTGGKRNHADDSTRRNIPQKDTLVKSEGGLQ